MRRPLFHGQLLRAGRKRGADDLTVGEAVCVALAWFYETRTSTEFSYSPDGYSEFMVDFGVGVTDHEPDETQMDEVAQLRAEMAARAALKESQPNE